MHQIQNRGENPNRILRLNSDQISNPAGVITDFFSTYHMKHVRDILWEWLWAGVANSDDRFSDPIDRSNLIFLYENLEKLMEASYILQKRAERKNKKKSRRERQASIPPTITQ